MAFKQTGTKFKSPASLSLIVLFLAVVALLTLCFGPKPDIMLLSLAGQGPQERFSYHYPPLEALSLATKYPRWYNVIAQEVNRGKLKVGLVNMKELGLGQKGLFNIVTVDFERVNNSLQWEDFYPGWIDEDAKWGSPLCPEIPMPRFDDYGDVEVVVARVPCGGGGGGEGKGVRDVFRLQVNLVVANLLARNEQEKVDRVGFAVFIGSCGPMWEIFRCEDQLWHEDDYWVYKPDLRRLKQKVLMPSGSCQLVPPMGDLGVIKCTGHEAWRSNSTHSILNNNPSQKPRQAYVTVLHSSESYVCGAIALAQSIIQTNTTRDLVLLADSSISRKSLQGLQLAGWKVKPIERIRSPHARRDAYNEWNYSKLRVWELTEYDNVIFIDSDLIVVKNMDDFFVYPQLSASGNDKVLFNSGVMLIEPSQCTFKILMEKRHKVASYNGGDQGFLNEMFTWWHRWPSRLNQLKIFNDEHNILNDVYAIHYLGLKPWMCYRDYDCNWDVEYLRTFASDAAHERWWKVYSDMPKRLQQYCSLTEEMDAKIREWRGEAKNANFPDAHWKIKVKDLRKWRLHSRVLAREWGL